MLFQVQLEQPNGRHEFIAQGEFNDAVKMLEWAVEVTKRHQALTGWQWLLVTELSTKFFWMKQAM